MQCKIIDIYVYIYKSLYRITTTTGKSLITIYSATIEIIELFREEIFYDQIVVDKCIYQGSIFNYMSMDISTSHTQK